MCFAQHCHKDDQLFPSLDHAGGHLSRAPRKWSGTPNKDVSRVEFVGGRPGSSRSSSPLSKRGEDEHMEWTVDLTIIPADLMHRSKVHLEPLCHEEVEGTLPEPLVIHPALPAHFCHPDLLIALA